MESVDWRLDSTSAVVIYYHYFLGLGKLLFLVWKNPYFQTVELKYFFIG